MTTLLSLRNLSVSADDLPLVDDVSLDIRAGEVLALVGKAVPGNRSPRFPLWACWGRG